MVAAEPVISDKYPFLRLLITIDGWQEEVTALVDTGFDGALVIPAAKAGHQGRIPASTVNWQLADGSVIESPVYLGTVEIRGLARVRNVVVAAMGEDYVLGRRIIDHFEVIFDHGKRIVVRL